MADHPNAALVRKGYAAVESGDFDALAALLADDILLHMPGKHQFAGDYRGRDAVLELMGRIGEYTDGTMNPEPHAILADDEHVVALEKFTASRGGRSLATDDLTVYHVKGGKITEMWLLSTDPYTQDEFFNG